MSQSVDQDGHRTESRRTLWPVGLTATIVFFATLLFAFVAWSTTQRTDLVAADYYERELAHQQEIERQQRAQTPDRRPVWQLEDEALVFDFPATGLPTEGEITLYRPDNADLDQSFAIALDPEGRQALDVALLAVGAWWVELRWTVDGEEHSLRERLQLG